MNQYQISTGYTNLKPVDVNFDPSDVAFLERGQHVQDRVEAAPSGETEVKTTQALFSTILSPNIHFNYDI